MKFEEAMKHLREGKEIGHPNMSYSFVLSDLESGQVVSIQSKYILSDDWAVKEKEVSITRSKFFEAVCDVKKTIIGQPMVYSEKHFLQYLADRLGL